MGSYAEYLWEGHEIHPVLNRDALRCVRCGIEFPGDEWLHTDEVVIRDVLKDHPCEPVRDDIAAPDG